MYLMCLCLKRLLLWNKHKHKAFMDGPQYSFIVIYIDLERT